MGVAQSEISRIEKRHDMLLSTLTSYLSAAGENPRVVVTVNGKDVELDLTTLAGALWGWTRSRSSRLDALRQRRFPDRTLAALVQSACNKPESRLITHNHVRSGHAAWMAGPCRIPKLTVRVRFPSPAPHAKSVAAQSNPTVSLKQVNAHSRPKTALVPLRVPIGHLGKCPWRLSVPKLTVRVRFPSSHVTCDPHAKAGHKQSGPFGAVFRSVRVQTNRPQHQSACHPRTRQGRGIVMAR